MKNLSAKRIIAAAITATLLIGAGAFAYNSRKVSAASENEANEEMQNCDGGWEASENYKMDDEAKAAFAKATRYLDGMDYEAIALLGKQVVAGTNYSILVKKAVVSPDATPEYSVITIYEDLDGNAEITGEKEIIGEQLDGGYTANDGDVEIAKNADIQKKLDAALDGFVGSDIEPIAYLGSQVVSGTNYLLLCKVTPVYPDAVSEYDLVNVYEDLDGNISLGDMETLELGASDDASAENAESVGTADGQEISASDLAN